jgi:triacylglycerol lipase
MISRRLLPILLVVVAVTGFGVGSWRGGHHHAAVKSSPPVTGSPPPSTSPPPPATDTPPPPPPVTGSPPTAMDSPACQPSGQHPNPVVLVHGTFAMTSWSLMGPTLAQLGYCVFTFDYGNRGTGEIAQSAQELAAFVDRVLAGTHAARVSIVGHSEGGMMPRYYIRFLGGAAKVQDLIGLSPSNHGTQNPLVLVGAQLGCTACAEQEAIGSPFLNKLNAGDETPGPVDYTVIQTAYDTVVTPYASAFLQGPADRVTNVTLQTACPSDVSGHLAMPTDAVALQWVENALGRAGPADPAFQPRCQ